MPQEPRFPLETAQKRANEFLEGNKDSVWFSAQSRSTDVVMEIYQCDLSQAQDIIVKGIVRLTRKDFSVTIMNWGGTVPCDVYGLEGYCDNDWYIKFRFEDESLDEISFHPPKTALKLQDGRVLKAKE